MRSIRNPLQAALLMVVLVCSCSDRTSRTILTQPQTGRYALTGRVRLSSAMTDETGQPLGTRVINDASGVRVRILRPDGSTDSVLTRSGGFEFRADDPGLYRVSCWVVGPDTVTTSDVTIVASDASFPDTLAIDPAGEISTYPNPFEQSHGVGVEFTPIAAQHVVIKFISLAGVTVRTDEQDLLAGQFYHVHWTGIDNTGQPVSLANYWAVVFRDGGYQYNLVLME